MSEAKGQDSFLSLNLPPAQIENLTALGYEHMTAVQAQALPLALARKDLIAQARTGSGKTAAFGIALLCHLNPRDFGTQSLILCPTRELCTQVATEIRRLARYLPNVKVVVLCGGQSLGPQIGSLAHGAHIVVGTPGRIKDHLLKETLKLERINTLVLDEADRMLDMGFSEDIEYIIGETPVARQTLMFSATFPQHIGSLSAQYQRDAQRITVETVAAETTIDQTYYLCGKKEEGTQRAEAVLRLLYHFSPESCAVFCNTRQATTEVAQVLSDAGLVAMALHGEMEQRERDQVLIQFRNGSCQVLVATDVAARGLDIEQLPMVINADLPRDLEVYTHRIGRTGRAGNEGAALSLFFENERFRVDALLERSDNAGAAQTKTIESVPKSRDTPATCNKQTLTIAGGRKNKIRPGDILGTLTAEGGIEGAAIGRIDILEFASFVAIDIDQIEAAITQLESRRIKGQKFKVRRLHTIASRTGRARH